MTKPKTWADLARSLDADWPPRQTMTLTDLVAEARAADWDFSSWCYASGYEASDLDARRIVECLLAYARLEGRAGRATQLHHHAENSDHRDSAAADARPRAAIPASKKASVRFHMCCGIPLLQKPC